MISTIPEVAFRAVVVSADGIRFSTTTPTAAERTSDLADYIADRCDYTLWPTAARKVRALLGAGQLDNAVVTYFANVGSRWDDERLELSEVIGATGEELR